MLSIYHKHYFKDLGDFCERLFEKKDLLLSKNDLFAISGVPVAIFGHICVYSSVEFIVKLDLEDLDPSMPNVNYLVKSMASKNFESNHLFVGLNRSIDCKNR